MVTRKSPQANLENKKTISYLLGFIMVLSLVYIVLEWGKADIVKAVTKNEFLETAVYELPPITRQNEVTPPPPPRQLSDTYIEVDNSENESSVIELSSDPATDNSDVKISDVGSVSYGNEIEDNADSEIHDWAEIAPKFNGDVNKYLSDNIRYPVIAIENQIEGRVICQFVVNKDGSITDLKVIRSIDPVLDKEAMRVLRNMPKWRPGIQNGKPVRVKFFIPVNFQLM
ncbi:MAG: energy transducer TonB [Paludibacter sp.]|nr:energy transducer TonB [Paludibacter sp.]